MTAGTPYGTTPPGVGPLAGYTVAVATDRRRHEIADLLERAGARTVGFQAIRSFSPLIDDSLSAITLACLAEPIDELIVSSAFGFSAWLRSAHRRQLGDALAAQFASARLLAGNPRAADALRDLGLTEIWSTVANRTEDLFRYLMAQSVRGRRVVVQADSPNLTELCHTLRNAGATVLEVPTFQCHRPAHADILRRLGEQVVHRQVEAVVLTSPPAAENLLAQAAADHRLDALLNRLIDDVPALCLGVLTGDVLRARGVAAVVPGRPYLDELVKVACAAVPRRAVRVDGRRHRLEIRGHAIVLNDALIPVQPGPIAVLRALARQPGRVLSFSDIRDATPNWAAIEDHAIEMAVSRLRRSLDGTDVVQTVVRRGYRLVL